MFSLNSDGPILAQKYKLKGEVRAICRFWVFDGNGLLGHRLIDSRWFEKNPPTECGWKRRSKKRPRTGISRGNDRDAICAFKFAPSRHAFDLHAFLRLTRALCRSLLVEGSVVRSWFLWNCSTRVPVDAPGITGSPSKRICHGTLSQKSWNWSIWQTAHGWPLPSLRTSLLWKVGMCVQSEDQRVFVCAKSSRFS